MFDFDDEQNEMFLKWDRKHRKVCVFKDPMKQGAIGGRLTYRFTPTSLGCITIVTCACGTELDLTDYNW